MLNGEGNENGIKINRSNQQKTNCTCSTLFFLISKKQICTCSTVFCLSLPLFFTTIQCRIVRLKRKTYKLHIIFMEELSYVFPKILFPVFTIATIFSLPLIFTQPLTFVNFLTAAMKFSCLSFNEIRLPGSFSVVHVSLNIKNNVKKTRLCCCFVFSL